MTNLRLDFQYRNPLGFTPPNLFDTQLSQSAFKSPQPLIRFEPTYLKKIQPDPKPVFQPHKIQRVTVQKPKNIKPIARPGLWSQIGRTAVQAGKAVLSGIKKAGQFVVRAFRKMFRLDRPQPAQVATPKALERYSNLKPMGNNVYRTDGGKTVAFLREWQQGSTFKIEGDNLRLIEGTTFEKSFGGLQRQDGKLLPVKMVGEGKSVVPIGIDFSRMPDKVALEIVSPMKVEGFGVVQSGELTVFSSGENSGVFRFTAAKVTIDGPLSGVLGGSAVDSTSHPATHGGERRYS